ncbi:AEC family transporter [Nitrosococcus watsonii]|uniref:Auxin Efflux Carrier n=1 Tax=Nitrosococcus watsoni (strain C-113) TaxID=105559 RepID=D8K5I8_NITWC|nr:AEC family transporter [Nitrosococcus watsonii]ADJ28165.1 Auxin Efflux Carrier [Nitrosococcus watsonii C-113]
MVEVLLQMAAFIACGSAWRYCSQQHLISPKNTREVLTELVYYLFLPALVLDVLWSADLGGTAGGIAVVAASGVFIAIALAWGAYRLLLAASCRSTQGALILAAGFPNATYLGLPVLQSTLGDWARAVAIQYDLFACTPLVLTLGIYIARIHGKDGKSTNHLLELLKTPPLWAAAMGVSLNLGGVPEPAEIHGFLDRMAASVVPLMLLSLGMGLEWSRRQWQHLPLLLPVLIIQLCLMPLWATFMSRFFAFDSSQQTAVILEAAMPSMVLGIVFCDRFHLNTSLYAAAVTFSTTLSLVTLPLWYQFLT